MDQPSRGFRIGALFAWPLAFALIAFSIARLGWPPGDSAMAQSSTGGAIKQLPKTLPKVLPTDLATPIPLPRPEPLRLTVAAQGAATEGGELTFRIALNRRIDKGFPVEFAFAGDVSVLSDGSGGRLLFPAGAMFVDVARRTIDDNLVNGDRRVVLTAGTPSIDRARAINRLAQGSGLIRDNDAAPIEPQASVGGAGAVAEGGRLVFPLSLDRPARQEVVVSYRIDDPQSATLSGQTGSTSIAPGRSDGGIAIATRDDKADAPDRRVQVRLLRAVNARLGKPLTGDGVVLDNDDPPAPIESEAPGPAESESPEPTQSETPAPIDSEAPGPTRSETPGPAESGSPAPSPDPTATGVTSGGDSGGDDGVGVVEPAAAWYDPFDLGWPGLLAPIALLFAAVGLAFQLLRHKPEPAGDKGDPPDAAPPPGLHIDCSASPASPQEPRGLGEVSIPDLQLTADVAPGEVRAPGPFETTLLETRDEPDDQL